MLLHITNTLIIEVGGDSEVISNPEVPRAVVAVALAADQVGDLTSQFSPSLVGIVMR